MPAGNGRREDKSEKIGKSFCTVERSQGTKANGDQEAGKGLVEIGNNFQDLEPQHPYRETPSARDLESSVKDARMKRLFGVDKGVSRSAEYV